MEYRRRGVENITVVDGHRCFFKKKTLCPGPAVAIGGLTHRNRGGRDGRL